jgi:hypothetical protein
VSPYVRTVRTASGTTAVRIVHSAHRGSRDIEHIGSAHDDIQLEVLKVVARQRLTAGKDQLDLGPGAHRAREAGRGWRTAADQVGADGSLVGRPGARLPGSGFEDADGGDEVFRQLVLARIISRSGRVRQPAAAGGRRRRDGQTFVVQLKTSCRPDIALTRPPAAARGLIRPRSQPAPEGPLGPPRPGTPIATVSRKVAASCLSDSVRSGLNGGIPAGRRFWFLIVVGNRLFGGG